MTTDIMTLREFADLLDDLADGWDGEDVAVLVGDLAAQSISVTKKDGYTQHGSVGYATEAFDDSGVWPLSNDADPRFYGTMLLPVSVLSEAGRDALDERIAEEDQGRLDELRELIDEPGGGR